MEKVTIQVVQLIHIKQIHLHLTLILCQLQISHSHITSLAAVGNDGTFGNTGSSYDYEAITGNPNAYGPLAYTSTDGSHTHAITAIGGTETKPKNVALIYIIKAV